MSDLSDGGQASLGEWGYGVSLYNLETGEYDQGGMVWHGDYPVTQADKAQCRAAVLHSPCKLDRRTFVGRDDPTYTTWYDENKGEYPYKQSITL